MFDIGDVEGNPRHTDSSYLAENTVQAVTHSIGPRRRLNTGHCIRPTEYKSAKTAVHRRIYFDWKKRKNPIGNLPAECMVQNSQHGVSENNQEKSANDCRGGLASYAVGSQAGLETAKAADQGHENRENL